MKYCLSADQPKEFLKQADEILVKGKDYQVVIDYLEDFPDKIIILDVPNERLEDEKFKEAINRYSDISENFICRIYNMKEINWFYENNIKFYYGYPISTYYDLQALLQLNVEYIKVTAPLTFDIAYLSTLEAKFRMVPNVAYDAYIPRENGVRGQWVRPEDVAYYEDGIYVFEFENVNLDQEQTLYKIYNVYKEWPGNLNILITNLNYDARNLRILNGIGKIRSNCLQKCQQGEICNVCPFLLDITHSKRVTQELKEKIAELEELRTIKTEEETESTEKPLEE